MIKWLQGEMDMFERILVPIDDSENSNRAIKDAVKIAKLTNATVTLIHVYPAGKTILTSDRQHFYELQKEECKKKLEKGKSIAKAEGLDVETIMLGGDPVEQIITVAKEGKFDLIVIGARGVSKLTALILGSVSQGVVNNAPCSVLVTK